MAETINMNSMDDPVSDSFDGTAQDKEYSSDYISAKIRHILGTIAVTTAVLTIIAGLLAIAGWIFGINILKSVNSSVISIKPNTAISFIILGTALLLEELFPGRKNISTIIRGLATVVILMSILTILEYIFNWDPGFDNMLFEDVPVANVTFYPGRMAFNTCICFILLGISLIFINTKLRPLIFLSKILPLISLLLGLLPILGYVYRNEQLLDLGFYTNISPYTAVIIVVNSLGIMCIWNYAGFLSVLSYSGPGGYMARRLIPVSILIPFLLIWGHLLLTHAQSEIGLPDVLIISFLYIAVFAFSVWKIAKKVTAIDEIRLNSEKALRQSENKFYTAFHSSPASLVITTLKEGKIIDSNDAYSKLTGIPTSEMIGKSTRSLNLWTDIALRDKMRDELERNGKVHNLEIQINSRGTIRTALASFESIMLNGEKCNISSAIDITEWKQAQDAIVTSEKQNQLANEILEHLNSNTDSVIMIKSVISSIRDRTGYEAVGIRLKEGEDFPYFGTDGFIPGFVESERYLCSYDESGSILRDAENNPLLDCMCGNILCNRVDSSKSFFTEGGSFRSNNTTSLLATTTDEDRIVRTRNRCNSSGYESVALIPLRSGNEIIGLLQLNDHRMNVFDEKIIPFFERMGSSIGIAVMRNKAENNLKKLNSELEKRVAERTEQLLDTNKELESFAYSVSHDLRAPLRHITGFSDILESELGERTNPEISRVTTLIKGAALRMSQLIGDLLSYSRTGRSELKTQNVSLNPVIEDIIEEASGHLKNSNIEWKINKLPSVKADPVLIRLVLQNLINNAIKFSGKKEKPVIEINYIKENNGQITFYIKDNGAGFNMKYVNKLFGVFQRLHTDEEFEGTGIGLATVMRILKKHGGTIRAEAVENEGATFYFTLPE